MKITDSIKWGETYTISAAPGDINGLPMDPSPLDETWQVAMRITKGESIGGALFLDPPMTVVDGAATCTIDTGDAPWAVGKYCYDIRFTDADGNDYWSDPVVLAIRPRNTPIS